jgi:mannose/fructose/N-acetylgalactosamine-specific phosphotransferase system component IID
MKDQLDESLRYFYVVLVVLAIGSYFLTGKLAGPMMFILLIVVVETYIQIHPQEPKDPN